MYQESNQIGNDSAAQGVSPGAPLASPQRRSLTGFLCIFLAGITLATYWPALKGRFVNFDDNDYVCLNPHVATGLTPANVGWAFTTGHASNWHPLTWLSHMLDVQIFGLNPSGHHAVNLLLHILNATVLLVILVQMTGAPWRSFVVAAFFALHPLHVESVAWISERKDVLSTLFFLVAIGAYVRWASREKSPQCNARLWYGIALGFFALGLMSKPMVVTLPFVLLLLDYWPLGRICPLQEISRLRQAFMLVREKLPFFAVAFVSCLITLLAQHRGHAIKSFLPVTLRAANAIVSYCSYLGKALWPTRLAVFYPHPNTRFNLPQKDALHPSSEQWPVWAIAIAAAMLVIVSALILKHRRRLPWLVTGWFWYLGTLVPVIGLVQVGIQGMADRYTYIPLIGVFIGVVWTAAALVQRHHRLFQPVLIGISAAVLVACALTAHHQANYWHDTLSLFSHALKVTSNNATAEWLVGSEIAERGQLGPAEARFRAALLDDPYCYQAHASLGEVLEIQGKTNAAIAEYALTLKMSPWNEFARLKLAATLRNLGRTNESIAEYQKVLEFNPDNAEANYELGAYFQDHGDLARARAFLDKTLRLKPNHVHALLCMWDLKSAEGDLPGAESALRKVVAIHPTNSDVRVNLGALLWQEGKLAEAVAEYSEAVRLRPDSAMGHYNLGLAYAAQKSFAEATNHFEEAIRLNPNYSEALSELAWLLATDPLPERRNGARALDLARRAIESGGQKSLRAWAALETAFAETGLFSEAIDAAEKARDMALAAGQTNAENLIESRVALYRNRQPFHSP